MTQLSRSNVANVPDDSLPNFNPLASSVLEVAFGDSGCEPPRTQNLHYQIANYMASKSFKYS